MEWKIPRARLVAGIAAVVLVGAVGVALAVALPAAGSTLETTTTGPSPFVICNGFPSPPAGQPSLAQSGSTLNVTTGSWLDCGLPMSYSYAWHGVAGSGTSYAVQSADNGVNVYVAVTACDSNGCNTVNTNTVTVSASGGGGGGGGGGSGSCSSSPCADTFDGGWTESLYTLAGSLIATRSGNDPGPYSFVGTGSTVMSTGGAVTSTSVAWTSASGCKTLDKYESGHSALFGSLLYRFHVRFHYCWSGGTVNNISVGTYTSNVAGNQLFDGLVAGTAQSYFYPWSGNTHGGYYVRREAQFTACVGTKTACAPIGYSYPYVQMWANSNGAWKESDGGGPTSIW